MASAQAQVPVKKDSTKKLDEKEEIKKGNNVEGAGNDPVKGEMESKKAKEPRTRSRSPAKKVGSEHNRELHHLVVSTDTNKNDPESVRCRIFIGNLNTEKVGREDLEKRFSEYGNVVGCSLHTNFGFVQYGTREEADLAVKETHGKIVFGKRVDANIASERRRPSGKNRKEERPPFSKGEDYNREDYKDSRRYRSRSPVPRYDKLYGSNDTMERYRDGRNADPYYKETFSSNMQSSLTKDYECEIIAVSPDLKTFCEAIQSRLQPMGISARMMFPPSELSVFDIIDRLAKNGCLYAVVVSSQNKVHQSCTLNILYGAPQEHRNMPLDDAVAFLARNFNQYLSDMKERGPSPWSAPSEMSIREEFASKTILTQDSYISGLLNLAASGKPLKVVEVNHLIEALIKYKNDIDGAPGSSGTMFESGSNSNATILPATSPNAVTFSTSEAQSSVVPNPGYGYYSYGRSSPGSSSKASNSFANPGYLDADSETTYQVNTESHGYRF